MRRSPQCRSTALTVAETADRLKVTRQTIYRLFNSGRLPGCRVGRVLRFPADQIERFERRRRRPSRRPLHRKRRTRREPPVSGIIERFC